MRPILGPPGAVRRPLGSRRAVLGCEGSHDERHALLRPRRAHEGADRPMGPAAEWECVLEAAALAAAWRQA